MAEIIIDMLSRKTSKLFVESYSHENFLSRLKVGNLIQVYFSNFFIHLVQKKQIESITNIFSVCHFWIKKFGSKFLVMTRWLVDSLTQLTIIWSNVRTIFNYQFYQVQFIFSVEKLPYDKSIRDKPTFLNIKHTSRIDEVLENQSRIVRRRAYKRQI